MTLGLRCCQPARRPHPASLSVRVPTVEDLLSASFSFASRLRLAVSLRLPSPAPVGSFHPTSCSPCWAQWRKLLSLQGRDSSRHRGDCRCGRDEQRQADSASAKLTHYPLARGGKRFFANASPRSRSGLPSKQLQELSSRRASMLDDRRQRAFLQVLVVVRNNDAPAALGVLEDVVRTAHVMKLEARTPQGAHDILRLESRQPLAHEASGNKTRICSLTGSLSEGMGNPSFCRLSI